MEFSDYHISPEFDLGSSGSDLGTDILELSDGNYVMLDYFSSTARLRKIKRDTDQVLETKYAVIDDGVTTAIPDSTNHIIQSHSLAVQWNQHRFIVAVPLSSGGIQINVWTDEMVLNRSFVLTSTHKYYGSLSSNAQGDFIYFGATNAWGDPKVFYCSHDASAPEWELAVNTGGNEWFHHCTFLSNNNLAVVSLQRTIGGNGYGYTSVIDRETQSVISGPTQTPVASRVNPEDSAFLVPYDDHFVLFRSGSGDTRQAVRYTNEGVLISQDSYTLEARGAGEDFRKTEGASCRIGPGEVIMVAYQDSESTNHLQLGLLHPNILDGERKMKEETMNLTQSGVDLSAPKIVPLRSQTGGFLLGYYDETNHKNYYRSFRSRIPRGSPPAGSSLDWGWWWKK